MRTSAVFLLSVFVVMTLFITQTTLSNVLWLYQIGMPVDLVMVFSAMVSDLIGMNFSGVFPIVGIIFSVLLVAFLVARILLIWISIDKEYFYALAGAAGLLVLVYFLPTFFYDLELVAGARSVYGKFYLTITGALGGYFFGINLEG